MVPAGGFVTLTQKVQKPQQELTPKQWPSALPQQHGCLETLLWGEAFARDADFRVACDTDFLVAHPTPP